MTVKNIWPTILIHALSAQQPYEIRNKVPNQNRGDEHKIVGGYTGIKPTKTRQYQMLA